MQHERLSIPPSSSSCYPWLGGGRERGRGRTRAGRVEGKAVEVGAKEERRGEAGIEVTGKEEKGRGAKRSRSSLSLLDHSRITGKFNVDQFLHTRLCLNGLQVHCHDLLGHYACVNTISFSNGDQSLMVSSGDDERVLVWRMLANPEGKPIREFLGHESNVFHAVFNSSNSHILSCGNDHSIKYYDVEASSSLAVTSLDSHIAAVYRVSFCPTNDNIFLSASEDRKTYLWDLREGNKPKTAVASSSAFRSVQWAPQGNFYVTANKRCGVQLWDIRASMMPRFIGSPASEPLVQYISRYRHASGAQFNSNGTQIIATIEKGGPTLYNIATRVPITEFHDPQYINSCTTKAASFIGNYDEFIACGSDDFRVYIWKVPGSETNNNNNTFSNTFNPNFDNNNNSNNNNNNNNINTNNNNNNNNEDNNQNFENNSSSFSPSKQNRVQKNAQSVLLGHRSIVNNVAWNKSLGVLCTAGVEKMVKVWSTFASYETDTLPIVHRPRRRAPVNFLGNLDDTSEGTVGESASTLGLFDLFLQMEEENAAVKRRATGGALMRRTEAYAEEGEGSERVVYTFEVQDSDSSDSEEEEEEEEEEDEEILFRSGPGFNFTFEMQDSESDSESGEEEGDEMEDAEYSEEGEEEDSEGEEDSKGEEESEEDEESEEEREQKKKKKKKKIEKEKEEEDDRKLIEVAGKSTAQGNPVQEWLDSLHLGIYWDNFREHGITSLSSLYSLTSPSLMSMGVSVAVHREMLLREIRDRI